MKGVASKRCPPLLCCTPYTVTYLSNCVQEAGKRLSDQYLVGDRTPQVHYREHIEQHLTRQLASSKKEYDAEVTLRRVT